MSWRDETQDATGLFSLREGKMVRVRRGILKGQLATVDTIRQINGVTRVHVTGDGKAATWLAPTSVEVVL